MKRRERITLQSGKFSYSEIDIKKRLNLEYLRYTNLSHSVGEHDLPALSCHTKIYPDYIALSGYPSQFHKTPLTAVGFWEYDDKFDGYDGLFNAIYYSRAERISYYRQRFSGVRIFFTPDYSQFGDVSDIENNYRILKSRIVGIWLAKELGAVVIPFVTVPTAKSASFALDGLEDCTVVAFSTKGYVNDPLERETLKQIVRLTVDTLNLEAIVVYDVCATNEAVDDIFAYPRTRGINIIVPANALKERNMARKKARLAKQ